jgi:hypothetical protein
MTDWLRDRRPADRASNILCMVRQDDDDLLAARLNVRPHQNGELRQGKRSNSNQETAPPHNAVTITFAQAPPGLQRTLGVQKCPCWSINPALSVLWELFSGSRSRSPRLSALWLDSYLRDHHAQWTLLILPTESEYPGSSLMAESVDHPKVPRYACFDIHCQHSMDFGDFDRLTILAIPLTINTNTLPTMPVFSSLDFLTLLVSGPSTPSSNNHSPRKSPRTGCHPHSHLHQSSSLRMARSYAPP